MHKFIISSVLVGILSVSSLALAENTNGNVPVPTHVPASSIIRAKMKEQKIMLKNNVQDVKRNIKDIKNEFKTAKDSLKDEVKKNRQEFNDMAKQKKTELGDEIKTKREELHKNLKKIQDINKQKEVEKLDKQIDELNSKMMTNFSDMLDKMSAKLVRIGERADKASQKGYDVSSVRTAINDAKKDIDGVSSLIVTQSGKTYIIHVTTETELKGSVAKARDALHGDITAVKKILLVASEAVHKADTILGRLKSPSPFY